MEIRETNVLVMGRWVMLGEIISLVEATAFPIDVKLTLSDTVSNPVKTHVDSFGSFLFDGVIGDAGSGAVVCLDGSRWLRMAKFFKTNT